MSSRLLSTAFLEPFFYPVHTYFAIRGNLEALRGKKSWGKAERSGFDKKKKVIHLSTFRSQSANVGKGMSPAATT